MTPETLQAVQAWVNTGAVVVLGILFILKTNKSQVSEIDSNTIASLKRQIEAYTSEVEGYKKQVQEFTLRIGHQEGVITTQKETIEKYEKILQNRNPELTTVLTEIRDFIKVLYESDKKVMRELNFQTGFLKKAEERNTKLDKAHTEIQKTL